MLATTSLADLNARKSLGRAYLEANKVEDALKVYSRILRDYPDDVDAYLFLGDCYLAEGDAEAALLLYTQALDHGSENPEVHKRIQLARSECVRSFQSQPAKVNLELAYNASVPSDPGALAGLLQNIAGPVQAVTEVDVMRAASLLEEIVHHPEPARAVAEHLVEIDTLVPALLELNIRQARSDGRPDLAQALQNLLENMHLQLKQEEPAKPAPQAASQVQVVSRDLRVLFVGDSPERQGARQEAFTQAMHAADCDVRFYHQFPFNQINDFDVVVAQNPHVDITTMEGMAASTAAKKPLVVCLDVDYEQMPVEHPDYETRGISTPSRARAYSAALLLADLICVPGQVLANTLHARGHRVHVIPDGWVAGIEQWDKTPPPRHSLNIGWLGDRGQVEDVFHIKRMVVRVVREFSHLRMVIGGDPTVYQLFDSLPEARRIFLPSVSPEDFPYVMGQMDILLVPVRNTPFNYSLSDRRLFEAGLRGIPWVASPVPAYQEWKNGGLIANSPDEWHTHLRQLVMDVNLRTTLGWTGKQLAQNRDSAFLARTWSEMLHGICSSFQSRR